MDWFEKLKITFDNLELEFEGRESSQEAMKRIVEVVEEVFNGNLLSLLSKVL
ncbi:hypothetical protein [Neobacillus soli]|uniref:hypothetical protein n=1 Tax=Neobacillus soli TaxID=220688 RepID=UPI000AB2CB98|nr:hypothetical protein [Neobacillus soli]